MTLRQTMWGVSAASALMIGATAVAQAGDVCGLGGGNPAFAAPAVACPKPVVAPPRPAATPDGATVAADGHSGSFGSTTWTVDGFVRGETVVGKRSTGAR